MFITVKREMGMLITVIRYLSYVNVVNCTKAPLRGGGVHNREEGEMARKSRAEGEIGAKM